MILTFHRETIGGKSLKGSLGGDNEEEKFEKQGPREKPGGVIHIRHMSALGAFLELLRISQPGCLLWLLFVVRASYSSVFIADLFWLTYYFFRFLNSSVISGLLIRSQDDFTSFCSNLFFIV